MRFSSFNQPILNIQLSDAINFQVCFCAIIYQKSTLIAWMIFIIQSKLPSMF